MPPEKDWTMPKPEKRELSWPLKNEYELDISKSFVMSYSNRKVPHGTSKILNDIVDASFINFDAKKFLFEDNLLVLCNDDKKAVKIVELKYVMTSNCHEVGEIKENLKKEISDLLGKKYLTKIENDQKYDYPKIEVGSEEVKEPAWSSLMSQIDKQPFVSLARQAELDAERAEADSKKSK